MVCIAVILLAFIVDTPNEIYNGYIKIIKSQSVLLTDYTVVGGLGATLVNVGLCGILILSIYYFNDMKLNGSLIMAFWLVFGFAFFGKNLVNICPILLGGYLHAKHKNESFTSYTLVTILSTTLAPAVSSVAYLFIGKGYFMAFLIATIFGIGIGYMMPPISTHTMKVHSGFNLYNVGFAGGIVGIFLMGFFHVFDKSFPILNYWGTEDKLVLSLLVIAICLLFIGFGFKTSENPKKSLKSISKSKGRLVSDFYLQHGNATFINVGINGLMALAVIYLIGSEVNGATLAGVFTTMGFGVFGKHPKNMIPVLVGAILMGGFTKNGLGSSSVVLGILFSTALAPIAGTFGLISGVIAGAMHIIIVVNLAPIHGGLSLYNNGLAAGLVCIILVPILTTFRKGDFN